MSLDGLKIDSAPLAFADIAAKHNAFVSMVASLVANTPLQLTLAERNGVLTLDLPALEALLESFIYDTASEAANVAIASALANYVTTTALATTLQNYVTTTSLTTTLANYVTTSAFSTLFNSNFEAVTNESNYSVCQNGSPVTVTFFTKP